MSYPREKLKNFIDVLSGFAFKSKDFTSAGVPVIKIKNVTPPTVTLDDLSYVSKEIAQAQNRFLLNYADVLIALTGSHINQMASVVGRVARVRHQTPSLLNQRVGKITVINPDEMDLDYVYYYLSQDLIKIQLASKAGGAANQANISPSDVKNLDIPFPNIDVQRRISGILSVYDNLIENNQKQIKLLEEAARRLYKEWFVDLRFPGYEDTPIVDGVPEGWKKCLLGDINCSLESGSRPKGGIDASLVDGVPSIGAENVIGLGCYNYSSEKLITKDFFSKMKRGKLCDKDILIYKDGAYIGRTSLFQDGFPHLEAAVNEHVFLLHAADEHIQYYLFFTLYQQEYYQKMQKLNKNAAQPGINSKAMMSLPVLLPTEDILDGFDSFATPLMHKIFNLAKQNRRLELARDRLLPKLMSGEIEV